MSQLVTGEAVALDLRTAALPSRVVAAAIDAALQFLVLAVLGGIATQVSFDVSPAAVDALGIVVLVVVLIVYPVTFETLLRGRTPGKAAMGLRVVRDDGGPIGFRQALVRGLAGAFIERPGITLFVAGVFTSLLNPQNKRVGDLLAGTVVLQERVTAKGGRVAEMPPQLATWAAGLDLSRVSDDLALSVRQFLSRAPQLTAAAREDLGGRLASAVVAAVGTPPSGTPGWAVLSAVLAERRRREHERMDSRGAGSGSWSGSGSAGFGAAEAKTPPTVDPPPVAREPESGPPAPGTGGFAAPF